MAKITASKKWDEARQRYIPDPDSYRIEGDGLIQISPEFLKEADPEFLKRDGDLIVIGPYRLEIVDVIGGRDDVVYCKVISDARTDSAEKREIKRMLIRSCARCGNDHEIVFQHFKGDSFEDADGVIYDWWGFCPVTGDPVLMTNRGPDIVDPTLDSELPGKAD